MPIASFSNLNTRNSVIDFLFLFLHRVSKISTCFYSDSLRLRRNIIFYVRIFMTLTIVHRFFLAFFLRFVRKHKLFILKKAITSVCVCGTCTFVERKIVIYLTVIYINICIHNILYREKRKDIFKSMYLCKRKKKGE